MTNPCDLIQRLADELQGYIDYAPYGPIDEEQALVDEARAYLATPEPAARPTDEEIMELMPQGFRDDLATAASCVAPNSTMAAGACRVVLNAGAVNHCRAVLARFGEANGQANA